jgi:hypothetical protein
MASVSVEPPAGWAPARLAIAALQRLGYTVTEMRAFGPDGEPCSVLVLR